MRIKPLRDDLYNVLEKHGLERKFVKQKLLFEQNYRYPSLHTEKIEPKHLNIYSFRIDRKWRAVFIVTEKNEAEIVDINPHYK